MANEQIDQESKNATIKILAILGSLAIIIIGVWLAVQVVRVLPSAFSSLASIAEEVYRGDRSEEFSVTPSKLAVESGDSLTLSWDKVNTPGTYRFRYTCADGASLALRVDSAVEYLGCDEIFSFSDNVTSLEVLAASERYRTAEVTYILTFTEEGAEDTFGEYQGSVAITNTAIAARDEDAETDEVEDTPATENEDTDYAAEPEATTDSYASPQTPKKKYVYFSYIPVSLDNGKVDLQARVVGIGYLKGKTFYPSRNIDIDRRAAIQIEIKNIGTKTSDEWDLDVELPNGTDYTLDNQKELKPNERQIVTIGFNAEDETGFEDFEGDVSVDDDVNKTNNRFSGTMRFVD